MHWVHRVRLGALGAGALGAPAPDAPDAPNAPSTSLLMTRPPSPVPLTVPSFTSCSSATRRAEGVERGWRASTGVLSSGGSSAAGLSADFSGGLSAEALAEAGWSFAPSSSMTPSTSPIFTSSPSRRSIRASTPACGAPTSRSILSVSSSTSGSPADTRSPSFFSQRETRASTIDSPSSGTTTFDDMSWTFDCVRSVTSRPVSRLRAWLPRWRIPSD